MENKVMGKETGRGEVKDFSIEETGPEIKLPRLLNRIPSILRRKGNPRQEKFRSLLEEQTLKKEGKKSRGDSRVVGNQ